jgi:hypothetical protein
VTTPLRLRIRNAEATGLEEEIREFTAPAIFGRSRDVDVLLLDPGISRRHASLRPGEDGGWSIEDLHSTRGTWVNGRRLAPGEITAIVEGDLLEINPWSLLVLGREATAGVVLDDRDVGGSIAEAVSDPQLRDRFDGLVSAVRRASTRTGEEEIFGALLECLLDGCELDRAMILRIEDEVTRAVAIRSSERSEETSPRPFSATLLKASIESGRTVRLEEHPDVDQAQSFVLAGVREALCRCIDVGTTEEGVRLAVYADCRMGIADDELVAWFDAIAELCSVSMRMQQGRVAESERAQMVAEMNAARAVQEVLLPSESGSLGDLSWQVVAIPGRTVAGDLVDVRRNGDGLHVVLGDVSGKGARAGMVMAGTQACADTLAESGLAPAEIVERLDAWAVRTIPEACFITLWCGRLDADGGVDFVDAGHGLALVQHADGSISPLVGARRPPLGIDAFPAEASKATLQPGEALILFSDGLAEEPSSSRDGDRYGLERIEASIDAHGADPAAILADLVDWCERDHFDDDLTVLVIRRAAD